MKKKLFFQLSKIFLFIGIILFISIFFWSYYFLKDMPQRARKLLESNNGIYVNLSRINQYITKSAIASQDERFYSNSGIDLKGTVRAVYYSMTTNKRQGASTITEQLIKNVYFSDIDNLKTDILTKILAIVATMEFSKNKILELYLNSIFYGHNAYGIEKASNYYFNRSANSVSLGEAAYIMALINAPSYLGTHEKQTVQWAKLILKSMLRDKYILNTQADNASMELNSIVK